MGKSNESNLEHLNGNDQEAVECMGLQLGMEM